MERKKNPALDLLEAVVVAVVLAMGIRFFLFEPFVIPSESMEPTLVPGDKVVVNKLAYRVGDPAPGDIVVFRYPLDTRTIYIKRLIAMPGETVELKRGQLLIDGQKIEEDFIAPDPGGGTDFGPVTIPPDTYFVMGDNRNNSLDSRVWGTVPRKLMLGKALIRYWPLDRFQMVG